MVSSKKFFCSRFWFLQLVFTVICCAHRAKSEHSKFVDSTRSLALPYAFCLSCCRRSSDAVGTHTQTHTQIELRVVQCCSCIPMQAQNYIMCLPAYICTYMHAYANVCMYIGFNINMLRLTLVFYIIYAEIKFSWVLMHVCVAKTVLL